MAKKNAYNFSDGKPTEEYQKWANEFLVILKKYDMVLSEASIDFDTHNIINCSSTHPNSTWGMESYEGYFEDEYTPEQAFNEDQSYA
jgi:hypothetical protein